MHDKIGVRIEALVRLKEGSVTEEERCNATDGWFGDVFVLWSHHHAPHQHLGA